MNPNGRRQISLRWKLLAGFTLIFTVVFGLAYFWFYQFATDMAMERVQQDLMDTLVATAAGVDGDAFADLAANGVPDGEGYTEDERYWEHVNWLGTVFEIEPRALAYSYVTTDEPDQVQFVGSVGAIFEPRAGAQFLEPWQVRPDRTMLKGLEEPSIYDVPYEDSFGNWGISGYTAITNAAGDVVGGLGIDFSAAYVNQVQQAIIDRMALAFGITYISLFFLVYLVSRAVTKPILQLTRAAEQIAEGNYETDLSGLQSSRFPDEITTLADVFALMVDKVYQREQKLRAQVQELKIVIDETKRRQEVQEIVDSDVFADLQKRAVAMRVQRQRKQAELAEERGEAAEPTPA